MAHEVTFVGFKGADRPNLPLDPPLVQTYGDALLYSDIIFFTG